MKPDKTSRSSDKDGGFHGRSPTGAKCFVRKKFKDEDLIEVEFFFYVLVLIKKIVKYRVVTYHILRSRYGDIKGAYEA